MAGAETVYNNRDNTIDLLLKADGSAQDLLSVTRMIIAERNGAFKIDSASSAAFNWNTGTTGKVTMSLGAEGLYPGIYVCSLIVYDPTNADGINWGQFVLKVVE